VRAQGGAALLLALLLVALVATLASGMVWQHWRAVQVEAAERARAQSAWILDGATDWVRLILREDRRSGSIDHLGEPWATPLAEARLSTFLAADRDRSDESDVEAFLSGEISDAQARYNLRNLFDAQGQPVAAELAVLVRLCAAAGVGPEVAVRIATLLQAAWHEGARGAGTGGGAAAAVPSAGAATIGDTRPLPVSDLMQLAWLGVDAQALRALRPWVDVLPTATPVNVNTAPREVIAAVLAVDGGTAERVVQRRQRGAYEILDQLRADLPPGMAVPAQRMSVATSHFRVRGRLRLDERVLEERSLMRRDPSGAVTVLDSRRVTALADAP
jgi:general secretion pathway protein K